MAVSSSSVDENGEHDYEEPLLITTSSSASSSSSDDHGGNRDIGISDAVDGVVDYKGEKVLDRSKYGGWKSAYFIIVIDVADSFTYWGISSNLISYLTGPLGQHLSRSILDHLILFCHLHIELDASHAHKLLGLISLRDETLKNVNPRAHSSIGGIILELTTSSRFLDKALINSSNSSSCTVSQVEEAKAVVRLVPIWITCLIYAIINAQSSTFGVKQGKQWTEK
ncbi:hypothetical protein MKW98_025661 [Papaver atlanticum]|uniref:Uncharacterized protein n=1 Tax=Papaver atlanticum TaxID=357466 RepID=A0AAD4SEK6_9MAGN|nr:hypothetical protein MKW98_025661 [Papaver atlanticum]